jgi:hypothetical protein
MLLPGVGSASKNEYQDTPGGKDGQCVRLTTYHRKVPMSRNLGALTSQNSPGPIGIIYLFKLNNAVVFVACSYNCRCSNNAKHFRSENLKEGTI